MILLLLYECSLSGGDTQSLLAVKKTTENKKTLKFLHSQAVGM